MGLDKLNAFCNFCICHLTRVAKHDTTRIFYLVIEKFTEILHVHLALIGVNDGGKTAKHCTLCICTLDRLDNVGKLTDARGLDKNSVGRIFVYNLFESLGKIAYERATDTTRIHLVDLNSRFRQKSAVNSYLAKLVLDKNKLFALVGFLYKLLYKCGLSRTEKA